LINTVEIWLLAAFISFRVGLKTNWGH